MLDTVSVKSMGCPGTRSVSGTAESVTATSEGSTRSPARTIPGVATNRPATSQQLNILPRSRLLETIDKHASQARAVHGSLRRARAAAT